MAKAKGQKRPGAPITVTAGRFAILMGVHHNTVGNWIKNEGLPAKRRGRDTDIDLAAGVAWVRARDRRDLEAELEALRQGRDPEANKNAKLAAETRLRELDVAEREGRLILADDVESRWSQIVAAIRESVMGVAGAAVQGGLIDPGQEVELEEMCRDALIALAPRAPKVAAVA
jgi:hypothetical protein